MERLLKIAPPIMPNFFCYEMPPSTREDGVKLNHSIPISELDEQEAYEFAEMMKKEFLKHWALKRKK